MVQCAAGAPRLLGPQASHVAEFLRSRLNDDGGFGDTRGRSDLYYTAFALQAMAALELPAPVERIANYLRTFGRGESLDFVHRCCLARCWGTLNAAAPGDDALAAADSLEAFRDAQGGYTQSPPQAGSVYACFLAMGAYEDAGSHMPDLAGPLQCIYACRAGDGGFANAPDQAVGTTPPTAAAVTMLAALNQPPEPAALDWLSARACGQGGFLASPQAPAPDLLSTAVTLHALAACGRPLDAFRSAGIDFVESLWAQDGGFSGHWAQGHADCEYTFYALLAMGHLAGQ